jgi:SWI/SNF-related matrix-associated actin-dependent regulator 1 of chromatin subfamily A
VFSYDLLSKKQAELERKDYQLVIMDESHCIKNDKSARTRAAEPLMKV